VLYPLYRAKWHLSPVVISAVFSAYPIMLVVFLGVAGGISDRIGRRRSMFAGALTIAVSCVVFAAANGVGWLFLGRALQGLGTGLSLSAASAAMAEYEPNGNATRAGALTTAATGLGLAVGSVSMGALVDCAPLPRVLGYLALLTGALVSAAFLVLMPDDRPLRPPGAPHWRPHLIRVPRQTAAPFVIGALAVSTAYVAGGSVLGLGTEMVRQLTHNSSAFFASLVLAILSVGTTMVSLAFRGLPPRISIPLGSVVALAGVATQVLAAVTGEFPLLLLMALLVGSGYGFLFMGGLALASSRTPKEDRGEVISALYMSAYLLQGIAVVGVGQLATHLGLKHAVEIFLPVVAALCVSTTLARVVTVRQQHQWPPPGPEVAVPPPPAPVTTGGRTDPTPTARSVEDPA
jgi:MFS family permease